MSKMNSVQLQYEGFIETEFLWHNNTIKDLQQFEFTKNTKTTVFIGDNSKKIRLGKWVERFVEHQIRENNNTNILATNIQIQNNKITVGELDCILLKDNQPIHLEIIYKFYLYDTTVGNAEIEHWIGPNRKDSFIQKIDKLSQKQLPLLFNKYTQPYLSELNLTTDIVKQQVYFKAQLFVPLKQYGNSFPLINNNCIQGFYIYAKELAQFSNEKFYIPCKHDWLVIPHKNVNWLSFTVFKLKIQQHLTDKNAPMYWMKKTNGELFKLFVVWW